MTITPIQSSHLLPYVINNTSSFYWLRIKCSPVSTAAGLSPTSLGSTSGKHLEKQLEELRLQRHERADSAKPTSTRAKLKRAARSFSDFFRGRSFSSRSRSAAMSTTPAGGKAVDDAFYGGGTKPITVEPFIWNEFPLEVGVCCHCCHCCCCCGRGDNGGSYGGVAMVRVSRSPSGTRAHSPSLSLVHVRRSTLRHSRGFECSSGACRAHTRSRLWA